MNIVFNETDLLKQLAELFLYVDEHGWDSVEFKRSGTDWYQVTLGGNNIAKAQYATDSISDFSRLEVRAKQKTITVYSSTTGEASEVPAPYKGDLEENTQYWVECFYEGDLIDSVYPDEISEITQLRGLIHLTKENAQISAEAKLL